MAKRSFLIPFAVALAALSQSTMAALKDVTELAPTTSSIHDDETPTLLRFSMPEKGQSEIAIIPSGQDLFKFVLHRAQDGQLFAAHESHYSHSSHQSHSSHYSSR